MAKKHIKGYSASLVTGAMGCKTKWDATTCPADW